MVKSHIFHKLWNVGHILQRPAVLESSARTFKDVENSRNLESLDALCNVPWRVCLVAAYIARWSGKTCMWKFWADPSENVVEYRSWAVLLTPKHLFEDHLVQLHLQRFGWVSEIWIENRSWSHTFRKHGELVRQLSGNSRATVGQLSDIVGQLSGNCRALACNCCACLVCLPPLTLLRRQHFAFQKPIFSIFMANWLKSGQIPKFLPNSPPSKQGKDDRNQQNPLWWPFVSVIQLGHRKHPQSKTNK